jgi:hypothetical protein
MVRRGVAAAAGILVLILLVIGIKNCREAQKEEAYRDYLREVNNLVQESQQESDELFKLLTDPQGGQEPVEIQQTVNGVKIQAAQLVDRAKDTDRPDEFETAHRYLLDVLELRRDAVTGISDREGLPTALGDEGREKANERIAIEMQSFLASDVLYNERVRGNLQTPLEKEKLVDEVTIPKSQFLPNIEWLNPSTVADRISRIRGGGGGRRGGPVAPGLHGTELETVTVKPEGEQLAPGGTATVRAGDDIAFDIQVSNGGENDERDVVVKLSVAGDGGRPIEREARIDAIAAGETKTASIPLGAAPPTGEPAKVEIEIVAVPGEKKVDNNKGSFTVTFTR